MNPTAARDAVYNKLGAELRSVIPPGQVSNGTITFWLALHDNSLISYERTGPWMAAIQFHARYFIAGHRAMTGGLPTDEAFIADLNRYLAEVIAQCKLVGQFPGPCYGDHKVYGLAAGRSTVLAECLYLIAKLTLDKSNFTRLE